MKKLHRIFSLLIAAAMITALAGCQKEVTAENLMENISAVNVPEKACDDDFAEEYTDFSLKLLRSMYNKEENTVVSPLAVSMSLSMLANGADGETLNAIESKLGMNLDNLNVYLKTYRDRLNDTEAAKLYLENSMWFNSDKNFVPNTEFLEANANYYNAAAFKQSFTSDIVQNINNWVSNETQENVDFVIKEVPQDAIMYLVNATEIVADWEKPYSYDQVKEADFKDVAGNVKKVQMMTAFDYDYLENATTRGFMKYYSGKNYALVVLRPDDYTKLEDYVSSLSYDKIRNLFKSKKEEVVESTMPKFECSYSGEISEYLKSLGFGRLFDENSAELGKVGTSDSKLYVDDIYTKAHIRVTEKGTNAGTAGSNANDTASQTHKVVVDRSFVYMVVDCTNYLPIIIGAVNSID